MRGADLVNCLPFKPDIVKPNVAELTETFYADAKDVNDAMLDDCLVQLYRKHGARAVVTRGAESTVFVDAAGSVQREAVEQLEAAEIVNTIGCGDSFAAGFVAAVTSRQQTEEGEDWVRRAVQAGHHAAALNAKTIIPGSLKP